MATALTIPSRARTPRNRLGMGGWRNDFTGDVLSSGISFQVRPFNRLDWRRPVSPVQVRRHCLERVREWVLYIERIGTEIDVLHGIRRSVNSPEEGLARFSGSIAAAPWERISKGKRND